jgi:hypothetical protein
MIMETSEVKFLAYVNCSSINSRSIVSVVTNYTVYTQSHTWSIHCIYGIEVFYGCNMWYLLCSVINIWYCYNSTFRRRCAVPSVAVPFSLM